MGWERAEQGDVCSECGDALDKGDDLYVADCEQFCEGCYEELELFCEEDTDYDIDFADPGGRSTLRAASGDNPRNLPCPTCGKPDRLTPRDRDEGYQCDACADAEECGP